MGIDGVATGAGGVVGGGKAGSGSKAGTGVGLGLGLGLGLGAQEMKNGLVSKTLSPELLASEQKMVDKIFQWQKVLLGYEVLLAKTRY